jgi:hypothetical protein
MLVGGGVVKRRTLSNESSDKTWRKRLVPPELRAQCKTTCVSERPVLLLKDLKALEGLEIVWNN